MSGKRTPPADRAREPSTAVKVALGVVALLGFAYSLLIATRPLLGVLFVAWIAGLYLLWRFLHHAGRLVRAVERLADAMEGRNRAGSENRREDGSRDRDREF